MSLLTRLAPAVLLCLLAAPLADAAEGGDHAWTNPGQVLPCEFRSGTLTVTGIFHSRGCDPDRDPTCGLVLEVVSIKDDSVRGYLARDPEGRCTIEVVDGRKRVVGPAWRRSGRGEKLVRASGVVTDGVLHLSRSRVLGGTAGLR